MLIQSVLIFILGIAATALVLILIAPVAWRRALFLARKVIASEVPLSLTEVQADRDFLRARHAVELVRLEEKYASLLERYNSQKIQLDSAKEQFYRMGEVEKRTLILEEQLADTRDELDVEKQLVTALENNNGRNLHELREFLFKEKLVRVDVAAQEAELKTLRAEISELKQLLAKSTQKTSNSGNDQSSIVKLRQEMIDLAALLAAKTADAEGETSPIRELVKGARGEKSLAARIRKQIAPNTVEKNKTTRKKQATKTKRQQKAVTD